jgi:hypothetical protein
MADDAQIQIAAILPGGQFFGLGLIEVENADVLIAFLASHDTRDGRSISLSDLRRAYDQAANAQRQTHRGDNNDHEADGA